MASSNGCFVRLVFVKPLTFVFDISLTPSSIASVVGSLKRYLHERENELDNAINGQMSVEISCSKVAAVRRLALFSSCLQRSSSISL
jgi:hypothetical protein